MSGACCSVGARPDAAEIDAALRASAEAIASGKDPPESINALARRTAASKTSILRHRDRCLGLVHLARGPDQVEVDRVARTPDLSGGPAVDRPVQLGPSAAPLEEAVDELARPLAKVPNPGDDPVTAPRKLITAEVERRVVRLRVRGKTWEEIGEQVGVDWGAAMDAAERVLLRTRGRADRLADQYREIELRRCDELIDALWDRATNPDMARVEVPTEETVKEYDLQDKAVERIVKLMERRAKLLGLDAPTGPVVQVNIGLDEASRAMAAFLLAAAPQVRPLFVEWLSAIRSGDAQAKTDPAAWVAARPVEYAEASR
jgi:hypothetical protein